MTTNWITNRNFDLLWYIGACLTSYAMIYLNLALGISAVMLWWIWIVSVDGPHVFATISRTYLDTQEREERRRLLLGSLLWFLLGPLCIAAAILSGAPMIFFMFITFAQLWAYWHVVRQHYGFLCMYQKKNGEPAGKANQLDYWIFYILMLAPFVSFLLRHPSARYQLGLGPVLSTPEHYALIFLHSLIALALIVYVFKEARNKTFNLPKNVFLMAAVPLHLLIFLHPYISTHVDIRLFAVFVTFYHNIQYHGIVWFYNRNRYRQDSSGARFGWASKVSRNFLTFYAVAIIFTLLYRYPNWYFAGTEIPFFGWQNNPVSRAMIGGSSFTISDLAIGFWWGFAFNHYYLDQKIWKLSKDKRLNQDLRIATPQTV
ncbi:MAG: hypothetical protein C5B54_06130 [Acidobacteria bacterium]|nr:MAG: hypothetical protein C5B54_06130 [Acidobacteriota bacterium]